VHCQTWLWSGTWHGTVRGVHGTECEQHLLVRPTSSKFKYML
jgi:hypothetical protein